jgi:hypothetical protein
MSQVKNEKTQVIIFVNYNNVSLFTNLKRQIIYYENNDVFYILSQWPP